MMFQLLNLCGSVLLSLTAVADVQTNPDHSFSNLDRAFIYDQHGNPMPRPLPKPPKILRPIAAPREAIVEALEKPPRIAIGRNQTFDLASRTRAVTLVEGFLKVELKEFTLEERQSLIAAIRRFEKTGEISRMVELLDAISTANLLLEASREVHMNKNEDLELQEERERKARAFLSLYSDLNTDLRRDIKTLESEQDVERRRTLEKNISSSFSEMLLQIKFLLQLLPHNVDFPEGLRIGKAAKDLPENGFE